MLAYLHVSKQLSVYFPSVWTELPEVRQSTRETTFRVLFTSLRLSLHERLSAGFSMCHFLKAAYNYLSPQRVVRYKNLHCIFSTQLLKEPRPILCMHFHVLGFFPFEYSITFLNHSPYFLSFPKFWYFNRIFTILAD